MKETSKLNQNKSTQRIFVINYVFGGKIEIT